MSTVTKEELKKLLKKAFDAGRDYQYTVNPYNGKPLNDKYPSFTKWYNKEVKGKNLFWTEKSRMDTLTEEIDDPHIETLTRMGR